jgi:hypothetical protein
MGQDGLARSVLSRLTFDAYIALMIALYPDPGQIREEDFFIVGGMPFFGEDR